MDSSKLLKEHPRAITTACGGCFIVFSSRKPNLSAPATQATIFVAATDQVKLTDLKLAGAVSRRSDEIGRLTGDQSEEVTIEVEPVKDDIGRRVGCHHGSSPQAGECWPETSRQELDLLYFCFRRPRSHIHTPGVSCCCLGLDAATPVVSARRCEREEKSSNSSSLSVTPKDHFITSSGYAVPFAKVANQKFNHIFILLIYYKTIDYESHPTWVS
ncbi:hypothetical protein E3N88_34845 [Mikania micrantha]|uniref:Uncharacterized protein n=1 Tax=Mikania micrantha TaxID=192012 RepID=A0A5N6LZB5_9ASTR|nr:hypothetical protein E3N88_34845 [Mikania micrantha]